MGQEQIQAWCNYCRRLTLHTRMRQEVNHVLHLLISLFLCGFWLPVWLLLTLVSGSRRGEPFRCTVCGSLVGQLSPEQTAAVIQQRAQAQQVQRQRRQEQAWAMRARLRAGARQCGRGLGVAWEWLQKLPGRTDRLLLRISGEEGDESRVLHQFLRWLVLGLLFAAAAVIVGLALALVAAFSR